MRRMTRAEGRKYPGRVDEGASESSGDKADKGSHNYYLRERADKASVDNKLKETAGAHNANKASVMNKRIKTTMALNKEGSGKSDPRERPEDEELKMKPPMIINNGITGENRDDLTALSLYTEEYWGKSKQKYAKIPDDPTALSHFTEYLRQSKQKEKKRCIRELKSRFREKLEKSIFKYKEEELIDANRMREFYERWRNFFCVERKGNSLAEHFGYFKKPCREMYQLNKRSYKHFVLNGTADRKRSYYWIDETAEE